MANQPIISDGELQAQAAALLANSEKLENTLHESIELILSLKGYAIEGDFADRITEFGELMELYLHDSYSSLAAEARGHINRLVEDVANADDAEGLAGA